MRLDRDEAVDISGAVFPVARTAMRNEKTDGPRETEEEVASYLFDILIGARRLAVARRHKFLAYLIGMAAEEARLLTQGRSAGRM
jgi:hypothetical protein